MLDASQVNTILDSVLDTIEAQAPAVAPFSVGTPEGVVLRGAYGSVVLGALVSGDLDGKITIILEWDLVTEIVAGVAHAKIESFESEQRQWLYNLFGQATDQMARKLGTPDRKVTISALPMLVDSSVLFGREGELGAIRLPVSSATGNLDVYLAFYG